MAQSTSDEFIELVAELMEEASSATLYIYTSRTYDPSTLSNTLDHLRPEPSCKTVFVAPQESTQIQYEREITSEDFTEHRVCLVDYRGDIKTMDKIDTALGEYYVTGVVAVAPLGVIIYQRLKISR